MLSETHQEHLMKVVNKLPPNDHLSALLSEDQIDHWYSCKRRWQFVLWGLKAFFAGRSITKALKEDLGYDDASLILPDIKRWIRLYELLNFGWEEIETAAKKQNFDLPVNEPGEAISFILNQNSAHEFDECLMKYFTFAPQSFYRDYKKAQKLWGKENSGAKLTPIEQRWVKKINAKVKNNLPGGDFPEAVYFEEFCLGVVSKSKDRAVRDSFREYNRLRAELREDLLKEFSPRREFKAWGWEDGKRLEGKRGGSYA